MLGISISEFPSKEEHFALFCLYYTQHAPEQDSEKVQSEKFNSRWQQANVDSALSVVEYCLYFFTAYYRILLQHYGTII